MVKYKLEHSEYLFVSANVVNHPRFQDIHNSHGAVIPFAPEQSAAHQTNDWRISVLPSSPLKQVLTMDDWPAAPEYKHRWLPMRNGIVDDCPLRQGIECSGKPRWQCAVIAHYSLFQHLEDRRHPGI
jgi:hypothetical protein